MPVHLQGRTILITGASSGIGAALARELAPRAGKLVLVARRRERLEALKQEIARPGLEVHVMPCDLADRAAASLFVEALESQVGPVDVLINNAGLGDFGLFDRSSWAKTRHVLDVNIVALTFLTHALVGPMVKRGTGAILNVSSGFGLTFLPGFAAYVGTKQFVTGFTECLRLELAGTGVVACQVCPGPVATEFGDVAGQPLGMEPPGWLQISAERCARESIRGLERGRAMIVPGIAMKLVLGLGRITPRWIQRLLYRPLGAYMRRHLVPAPAPAPSAAR